MSTNPTTKSQVQAYRFVLRRMESALVGKDAVMLHEPTRQHLRAMAVGLILGLLALAGFFVFGKIHPASKVSANEMIAGSSSTWGIVRAGPEHTIQRCWLTERGLLTLSQRYVS